MSTLLQALQPMLQAVARTDLSDPAAVTLLQKAVHAEQIATWERALLEAHAHGTLTPHEGGPFVRFGRIAKPSTETLGLSVDVVEMTGAGLGHTHPTGEVSWCIALEGEPTFEGVSHGWCVMAPGSHHVPTVQGGRMLIVYAIPEGAMVWDKNERG